MSGGLSLKKLSLCIRMRDGAEHKVPSSGVKTALIQRVREHRSGLARRRVGEKSVREDSGGVRGVGDGEKEAEDEIDMPSAADGEDEGGEENDIGVSFYFEEDEDEEEEYADSDDSLQND